jgi:peptidoglycan/LPS O-acetylase OafA/YrhL
VSADTYVNQRPDRPRAEEPPAAGALALPRLPARLAQVDLLKGLAILAVLLLHGLPLDVIQSAPALFTIGQAVPVFVVLMGLNATSSGWRRGELYTRRYLLSRVDRLVVPFLAVYVVAAVIALARGSISIPGVALGWVAGVMPLSGPGNYFIPFTFQFAALFPLYLWCYRRRPGLTTAAAFAVGLAFELAAARVAVFDSTPILYSACILHWLPFVALGVVLADLMLGGRPLPRAWLVLGAVSAAYLLIVHLDENAFPLANDDWRATGQTFASAFYPALLVVAGLRLLPRVAGAGPWRLLATLGVASYEIFLVQMVWFALLPDRGAIVVLDILACCLIGYALHMALRRVPALAGRRAQPAA